MDIEGQKRTIREWITVRQNTGVFYKNLFTVFNLNHANSVLQQTKPDLGKEGISISLKRMYNEDEVKQERDKYTLMFDKINSTLEVVNATTDLIEQ